MKPNELTERIMRERFGGDALIALATVENGKPFVREVDGNYYDGCFYVVTHAKSRKMQQLAKDPSAAVSGEWFSAVGTGENMGHPCAEANLALRERLRLAFSTWYTMGHVDESDPDTCILRIRLQEGTLFADGQRYDIEF